MEEKETQKTGSVLLPILITAAILIGTAFVAAKFGLVVVPMASNEPAQVSAEKPDALAIPTATGGLEYPEGKLVFRVRRECLPPKFDKCRDVVEDVRWQSNSALAALSAMTEKKPDDMSPAEAAAVLGQLPNLLNMSQDDIDNGKPGTPEGVVKALMGLKELANLPKTD